MSEEMIIRHCSPTLAGLKTGNLFSCNVATKEELFNMVRKLNRTLGKKGLRVLPLKYLGGHALIYVYRPNKLKEDLCDSAACNLLQRYGYACENPQKCVVRLINRLKEIDKFPHEIGLFLGYPPEDVEGFIDNKACGFKCVGHWKVYGDAEKAQKTFQLYKKCTAVYYSQWLKGTPIERLTV